MSGNSNGQSTALVRPNGDSYDASGRVIARQGFGSQELESTRETQGIAAAETAKALVQARFIMAMQRPRDVDDFRARLLKHCKRPRFAAAAEYAKPVGGSKIRGVSVRFVEAALAEFRNVQVSATPIYDDEEKRIVRVTVSDLEANNTHELDVTAEKFVERKSPTGDVIRERRKKNGDSVYLIRATEDDYANKIGAAVSKAVRNLGLRVLPPDIVAECMEVCLAVRDSEDARDPDAARKAIADAFAGVGVMPVQLKEYLGHEIATCSTIEIDDLRAVFVAIRDNETSWASAMDAKRAERGEGAPVAPADKVGDKLKDKLATAPAKDKQPTEKPKARTPAAIDARRRGLASAIEWSRNGDRHLGCVEDLELAIEQTGPTSWGWWLTRNGEAIEDGDALDLETAKGKGLEAAAKLEPPR